MEGLLRGGLFSHYSLAHKILDSGHRLLQFGEQGRMETVEFDMLYIIVTTLYAISAGLICSAGLMSTEKLI